MFSSWEFLESIFSEPNSNILKKKNKLITEAELWVETDEEVELYRVPGSVIESNS